MSPRRPSLEQLTTPILSVPPLAPSMSTSVEVLSHRSPPAQQAPAQDNSSKLSPARFRRRRASISTVGTSVKDSVFSDSECPSTPATFASDCEPFRSKDITDNLVSYDAAATSSLSDPTGVRETGTCFDTVFSQDENVMLPSSNSDLQPLEAGRSKRVARVTTALSKFQQAFNAKPEAQHPSPEIGAGIDSEFEADAHGYSAPNKSSQILPGPMIDGIQNTLQFMFSTLLVCCLIFLTVAVALECWTSEELPSFHDHGAWSVLSHCFTSAASTLTQIFAESPLPWLVFCTAFALPVWALVFALHTLAKVISTEPCVERTILPLLVNGSPIDAWPDSAGITAMSKPMAAALGLAIDVEKTHLLETGLQTLFWTCGQVKANVAFPGSTEIQQVTFDVLPFWLKGLPEVTVGEDFLDKHQLLNFEDPRYETRPCNICVYIALFAITQMRQKLRLLPVSIELSGGHDSVDALIDSGSTWDGMSLEYAAQHYPRGAWRYHHTKHVKCPDGTTVRAKWSVDTTIRVANQPFQRNFYIIPRLARSIVLGRDFCHLYNPFEKFKGLIIQEQNNEARHHFTMVKVGPANSWLMWVGRKVGGRFGKAQVTTEIERLRQELDNMDSDEMDAKHKDAKLADNHRLHRVTDAAKDAADRATAERLSRFERARQLKLKEIKTAETSEPGTARPNSTSHGTPPLIARSSNPATSGGQGTHTIANGQNLPPGSGTQLAVRRSESSSAFFTPSAFPGSEESRHVVFQGNGTTHSPQPQLIPFMQSSYEQHPITSSSIHHHDDFRNRNILRPDNNYSSSTSPAASITSRQRPGSSGQPTIIQGITRVPTTSSQDSYHTAVTIGPRTPSFPLSTSSQSQTNLVSGTLAVPAALPERISIQMHSPLRQSEQAISTIDEDNGAALNESAPESVLPNGDSRDDGRTPDSGQSNQSLPTQPDDFMKHDRNDAEPTIAFAETPPR